MRKPCFILIIFVLLAFGGSLAVPAEDVPETAYDESETLPYNGTPLFSIAAPQTSSRIAKAELRCGFLFRSASLMKRCKLRRKNNALPGRVPDFVTVLNHSFRC
jgi:hypothetical protein